MCYMVFLLYMKFDKIKKNHWFVDFLKDISRGNTSIKNAKDERFQTKL